MKDYFEILQISDDADDSTIDKAYKELLIKYPADKYPVENSNFEAAYRTLMKHSMRDTCLDFHHMQFTSKQVYKLAEQALAEGNYNSIIKLLDKTIKTEKYNDHLYHILGIACLGAEKYTKAVKAFDQVLLKYPNDIDLLLHHTQACIASKNYKKAIISAKKGFYHGNDNILFALYLVNAYIQTGKYEEAEEILKESIDNISFQKNKYGICTRLAFVLSLEHKFDESLKYMEMLLKLDAEKDDMADSCEMLISSMEYYLENELYAEANRCMGVIIKLLPDRKDIIETKKYVERILELEPVLCRFEEDETIPEGLIGLVINELFPEASTGMTEEQKEAYTVMNEYQILLDFSTYLMPLRYMKTKYPEMYEFKKVFFDEIQDSKKRKILKTRYQTLIYKYQDIFEEMMDEWEEDEEDDDYENEEVGHVDKSKNGVSSTAKNGRVPAKELSNVRPFIRRGEKIGRNDPCPCGSGKKYKMCCGKDNRTDEGD